MNTIGSVGSVDISYKKDRSARTEGLYHHAIFHANNKYDTPVKVRLELKILKDGSVLGRTHCETPITEPGETSSARPYDANNKPVGVQKKGEMRLISIQVLAEENQNWNVIESKSYDDLVIMKRACYIATYAFADEEHEEVEALRLFRDQVLMRHDAGRRFVNAYYEHQEQVSLLLGGSKMVRSLCRSIIYVFNRISPFFLHLAKKN